MHSDSFFYKGKAHDICEDYALSGVAKGIVDTSYERPIAVVCDGCSGSDNTDFGVRVIAKVAVEESRILLTEEPQFFGSSVILRARAIVNGAGWNLDCLDTTLMVAISSKEYTDIFVVGDGVVMVMHDSENYMIYDITYPSNAPRYLNYWHDEGRSQSYEALYGTMREIYSYEFVGGKQVKEPCEQYSTTSFWSIRVPNDNLDKVVLMSDGVHSFHKKLVDNGKRYVTVPMLDVLNEVAMFKNTKGEFVKRRVKRFAKETEWENNDDVSVAAICVKD